MYVEKSKNSLLSIKEDFI